MLGGWLESQRGAPGPLEPFLPPLRPQGLGRGEKGAGQWDVGECPDPKVLERLAVRGIYGCRSMPKEEVW